MAAERGWADVGASAMTRCMKCLEIQSCISCREHNREYRREEETRKGNTTPEEWLDLAVKESELNDY